MNNIIKNNIINIIWPNCILGKVVNYENGTGKASTEEHGEVTISWYELLPFADERELATNLQKGDDLIFDISSIKKKGLKTADNIKKISENGWNF